jgi:hypothetical protein
MGPTTIKKNEYKIIFLHVALKIVLTNSFLCAIMSFLHEIINNIFFIYLLYISIGIFINYHVVLYSSE